MDIWDHTQLRPERERFRRHLDFSRLGQPRDAFALEVGERWLQQSHGQLSCLKSSWFCEIRYSAIRLTCIGHQIGKSN